MRVILTLAALLLATNAFAGSLTATWLPVTTFEDLTPIPATTPVTYRMQWGPEGTSLSNLLRTSQTSGTAPDLAPGRYCTQVVSIVDGIESLPTAPVCVTIAAPPKKKPAAPTGLAVTVAP